MARNVQKAFRGREPPLKVLLGEVSGACAPAHSPPGTRACGKGQLALSQLPCSLQCGVFLKLFINLSAGPCFLLIRKSSLSAVSPEAGLTSTRSDTELRYF